MPDRDSVVRSAHRETVAVVVGRNVHNDACEAHACVTALCEPPELHLHAPGVHSFKKKKKKKREREQKDGKTKKQTHSHFHSLLLLDAVIDGGGGASSTSQGDV